MTLRGHTTINYGTVSQNHSRRRRRRRRLYHMGWEYCSDCDAANKGGIIFLQIIIYIYAMTLDGQHSTRTHTTINQKQSAVMEVRRERRCCHRGGEDLSFW